MQKLPPLSYRLETVNLSNLAAKSVECSGPNGINFPMNMVESPSSCTSTCPSTCPSTPPHLRVLQFRSSRQRRQLRHFASFHSLFLLLFIFSYIHFSFIFSLFRPIFLLYLSRSAHPKNSEKDKKMIVNIENDRQSCSGDSIRSSIQVNFGLRLFQRFFYKLQKLNI